MITNRMFLKNDQVFKLACAIAKTNTTKRQASKFRNQKGSAYLWKKSAEAMLQLHSFDKCLEAVKTGGDA